MVTIKNMIKVKILVTQTSVWSMVGFESPGAESVKRGEEMGGEVWESTFAYCVRVNPVILTG